MGLEKDDLVLIRDIVSDVLETNLQPIKEDISVLKEDVSGLKQDVAVLKEDVSGLKQDVVVLKEDVSRLEGGVARLNLIVENELRPNIQLLAEGHGHVIRRLDKIDGDIEHLSKRLFTTEARVVHLMDEG